MYVLILGFYRLRRRRPEAQDLPDDSVVTQLHEEIHDGVGRRRAPFFRREAPQRQHLLAMLVEVGAVTLQVRTGPFGIVIARSRLRLIVRRATGIATGLRARPRRMAKRLHRFWLFSSVLQDASFAGATAIAFCTAAESPGDQD